MVYQPQIFIHLSDDNLIRFFFHLVKSENWKQPNLEMDVLAIHYNHSHFCLFVLFLFILSGVTYVAAVNW